MIVYVKYDVLVCCCGGPAQPTRLGNRIRFGRACVRVACLCQIGVLVLLGAGDLGHGRGHGLGVGLLWAQTSNG